MAIQQDIVFLTSQDFLHYSAQTLQILENIPYLAKKHNLTSKHLYKSFQGIFAQGNLELLQKPKIAIIGTRTPNQYTKNYVANIANQLAQKGFVIVSGGAIGVDAIAHKHSQNNAILVLPSGIQQNYPKENLNLIESLRQHALVLSEYSDNFMPRSYSFLERNRIIIALSDIIFIPQADLQSGSSSSANLSVVLKKPLFVLPHRMNESLATQQLLLENKASCIHNIDIFLQHLCQQFNLNASICQNDEILEFARQHGLFEEALQKFGNKVLEYELEGKICRNGTYIQIV